MEAQVLSYGEDKLLCFNGYGKLTTDFDLFQPFFEKDYHAIAINLPFHGKSKWSLKKDRKEIWTILFEKLGWKNEKVNILAYSIGARYLYSIIELFPEKIDTVYLIAPDGITPNPISHIATFTSIGKSLMNAFIGKATFILWVLKLLKSTKVLAESDYAFFLRKISSKQDRQQLQNVWDEVYTTTPNYHDLQKTPNLNHIQFQYILGKKDKVFAFNKITKHIPNLRNHCIHPIQSGHAMLTTITARKLKEIRDTILPE